MTDLKPVKLKDTVKVATPFIKKDVTVKKRPKEMWLKTPYHMQCINEDSSVMRDEDGDALAVPLLTKVASVEGIRLIKKYQAEVQVDEDGNIEAMTQFGPASQAEIDAYESEMEKRRTIRAEVIRNRKVKEAKTIAVISQSQLEEATGIAEKPKAKKVTE